MFSHIKDLIQDVLHNKEFDTDNVDHNMHYRLMSAVADGEMDILGMWREGDGIRVTMGRSILQAQGGGCAA